MIKKTLCTLTCSLLAVAAYAGTTPVYSGKTTQPTVDPISPVLISYDNVSLGYLYRSADFLGSDVDGHGAALNLEVSPVDHLYLTLGGSWTSLDLLGLDLDYWQGKAGIGGYIPLSENIHFVLEGGASYYNVNLGDFDVGTDDWGIYAMPHLRMKFGAFETHIGGTYDSNELAMSRYTAFARLLYEITPSLDIYASVNRGFRHNSDFNDAYAVQAGLRFKF